MKSTFQIIAAVACALALTACGGGNGTPAATTPVVAQPAFQKIDTLVGTGAEAASGDLLVIHYTGWLYDASKSNFKGDKIDSSIDRNVPLSFTIGTGQKIPGMDQGILGMKVGGKRTLIVPAAMAFGTAQTAMPTVGGNVYAAIPANSALVYDVELVSVVKPVVPVVVAPPPTVLEISNNVAGTGASAANGNTVAINYTLWLYDGSRTDLKGFKVETSVGSASGPTTFVLGTGNVIAGWHQGILGMQVGGKRTLTVPPDLAYGSVAHGTNIPANATLIFDIELVTVK